MCSLKVATTLAFMQRDCKGDCKRDCKGDCRETVVKVSNPVD